MSFYNSHANNGFASWAQEYDQRTAGPNLNNLITLEVSTLNSISTMLQTQIQQNATTSPVAMRIYDECTSNRQRFEHLASSAAMLLHYLINSPETDQNVGREAILQQAVTMAYVIRQVKLLDADFALQQKTNQIAPDRFKLLSECRNQMMGLAGMVTRWAQWLEANNWTYTGPASVRGRPQQNGFQQPVNNFTQPQQSQPINLGASTAATNLDTSCIMGARALTPQEEDLVSRFNYDDDIKHYQPEPEPQPVTNDYYDRRANRPQPVEVPEPAIPAGIRDQYGMAQSFAEEEVDPIFEQLNPLHIDPSCMPDENSDTQRFGPVVSQARYWELRLTAKRFDPLRPWPICYDLTQFARRAYVDKDGLLHETLVKLSTLTDAEMNYIEMETDPEARRQAELAMQGLMEKEPIRVKSSSTEPKEKQPLVVGVSREPELIILEEPVTVTSERDAETKASVVAIHQTSQDINQNDAIAYVANIVEHLGVYTNIEEFREFLDAFNVETIGRDQLLDCAQGLKDWEGRLPSRIWNTINGKATSEINAWLERLIPGRELTIDSFAHDMGELLVYLVEKMKLNRSTVENSIGTSAADWLRGLKCLHASPDGIGQWHLREEIAFTYNLTDYMEELARHVNAVEAARIEYHNSVKEMLAADPDLGDDERHERLTEEMQKYIENEKEAPLDGNVTSVWWMNHSVFMQTVHVALRVPFDAKDLTLSPKGYTHASTTTNPAIANLLARTYDAYEKQIVKLGRIAMYLSDGTRINVFRINASQGNQEFLLERAK